MEESAALFDEKSAQASKRLLTYNSSTLQFEDGALEAEFLAWYVGHNLAVAKFSVVMTYVLAVVWTSCIGRVVNTDVWNLIYLIPWLSVLFLKRGSLIRERIHMSWSTLSLCITLFQSVYFGYTFTAVANHYLDSSSTCKSESIFVSPDQYFSPSQSASAAILAAQQYDLPIPNTTLIWIVWAWWNTCFCGGVTMGARPIFIACVQCVIISLAVFIASPFFFATHYWLYYSSLHFLLVVHQAAFFSVVLVSQWHAERQARQLFVRTTQLTDQLTKEKEQYLRDLAKHATDLFEVERAKPLWLIQEDDLKCASSFKPFMSCSCNYNGFLGSGSFGTVHHALWHGAEVAIKFRKQLYCREGNSTDIFIKEMEVRAVYIHWISVTALHAMTLHDAWHDVHVVFNKEVNSVCGFLFVTLDLLLTPHLPPSPLPSLRRQCLAFAIRTSCST
jgi:hypothetical protein